MDLSPTVTEINLISVEYRKIFQPRVFCAPGEGVPLEIGHQRSGSKTKTTKLSGPRKNI